MLEVEEDLACELRKWVRGFEGRKCVLGIGKYTLWNWLLGMDSGFYGADSGYWLEYWHGTGLLGKWSVEYQSGIWKDRYVSGEKKGWDRR